MSQSQPHFLSIRESEDCLWNSFIRLESLRTGLIFCQLTVHQSTEMIMLLIANHTWDLAHRKHGELSLKNHLRLEGVRHVLSA